MQVFFCSGKYLTTLGYFGAGGNDGEGA